MKINRIIFVLLVLIACEKNEIPVPPHQSGEELTNFVAIGNDYGNQIFFSLDKNQVVSTNLKTTWDLAFETDQDGYLIRLNSSKGMAITQKIQPFEMTLDTIGSNWKWDAHSGNPDSTAIGNWTTFDGTYIINMGYNQLGNHLGFSKLKINSVDENSYHIMFGNLSATTPTNATIQKNNNYTFSYFSIINQTAVYVAPKKTDWDLLFTQYTHIFDYTTPYLVTGVLINPQSTSVSVIKTKPFSDISFTDINDLIFSENYDVIGYNWKYFNFGLGIYEVDASITYIIKTQKDYFYKFHFIDFYNESGIKGYPKFEFQQL